MMSLEIVRKKSFCHSFRNILEEKWNVILYSISFLFFILTTCLAVFFLSRVYSASVIVDSDHADTVQIYFDYSIFSPHFKEQKSLSKEVLTGDKKTLAFKFPAMPVNYIRIDPGEKKGKVKIYQIRIQQELGREIVLSYKDIYAGFYCADNNVDMVLGDSFVELSITGEDPQLISSSKLLKKTFPIFIFVPVAVITFCFYLFLSRFSLSFLLSFFLPHRKQPSSSTSVIEPLDGLRGYAALLVVAEHTWHPFLGAGHSGVLIFFSLSGFLLARPYVENPARLFSLVEISKYIERRVKRIFPLYLIYLFLVYGISLRLGDFFLHAFFIKGLGHLWTLPQEMLFYFLFPFILAVNWLLLRNNLLLIIFFLCSVIGGWYDFSSGEIYLYGMFFSKLPFMLPAFLSGTLFSYVYYRFLKDITPSQNIRILLSLIAIGIVITFTFFSNGQLLDSSDIYAFRFRTTYGVCAALLILILVFMGDCFFTKLFSQPFLVSIGVVSYGLYLFHPLVINLIDKFHLTGGIRFAATLLCSYVVACFTYHLLEAPFLTKTRKEVIIKNS